MEIWGWVAAYVVLFALLHLGLYVYYRRGGEESTSTPTLTDRDYAGPRSTSGADHLHGPPDEDANRDRDRRPSRRPGPEPGVDPDRNIDPGYDGETVRCPQCGVRNVADQTYTYCWNCISTLRP